MEYLISTRIHYGILALTFSKISIAQFLSRKLSIASAFQMGSERQAAVFRYLFKPLVVNQNFVKIKSYQFNPIQSSVNRSEALNGVHGYFCSFMLSYEM